MDRVRLYLNYVVSRNFSLVWLTSIGNKGGAGITNDLSVVGNPTTSAGSEVYPNPTPRSETRSTALKYEALSADSLALV